MGRITGVILSVSLLLCIIPVMSVNAGERTSASACVLIEAVTGRIIYAENAEEKLPMASTTKIMTVLLTLESGDLDEPFQVDNEAIHVEGSSMGLREGDIVTKRALCYGMLLPSGNDAANAAAVAVAGSIPAFAECMNERAEEIGMTRSFFVTPSGLDAPGHGASALDMAKLAAEALRNPDFTEICSQSSAPVTFGDPPLKRTLYNSNKLLQMYDGVIGVKTGFTDEAGRCLVSACERNGVTLICVTLHDPNDWQDHMQLYDFGFPQLQAKELLIPEQLEQKIAGGTQEAVPLVPSETITAGMPDGAEDIEIRVLQSPFAYAPIRSGDKLAVLEYIYDDRVFAVVPLCSAQDVAIPEPDEEPFWEKCIGWLKGIFCSAG